MPDEREWVKNILAGDVEAQTRFYKENARRLFHICIHFLGPEDEDAEDILQQTFLIALGKLKEFEFRSTLYTWLSNICANLCFERLRRKKKVLASLQEDLERLSLAKAPSPGEERDAEEEKQARLALLGRIANTLSERCRRVLELRDKKGESYINISRALKIPMGTVMSQLARCRKALRNLFESEWKGKNP
jgi:RNA polymerase sigma-70 factor (ECF subfamily)